MNKKIAIYISFFVLCILLAIIQIRRNTPISIERKIQTITVNQSIIDGEKKLTTRRKMFVGATALQLLSSSYNVATQGKRENAFVTTINNRAVNPQNKEFWAFYVNGKQATIGAGSYVLKNNDTIEWKIETY